MAQQMEIDFDVPKFLHEERQKAPTQLQHYYTTFEDLYERKYVFFIESDARFLHYLEKEDNGEKVKEADLLLFL